MKLVISNDVMLTVKEYEESLKDYPISNSRRKTKVTKLMRALKGIRKIPMSFPICKYKDLGQHFDSSGKPLFAFLRQFNYEDESKFQWSFAFVIDTANKTITITKMSPSIFIKENKQNKTYKTMKRIRLTESQLHNVIRKCINEALDSERFDAYHICSIGDTENGEDAEEALQLVDRYKHREMTGEEIIDYLLDVYGTTGDSDEPESVSRVNNRVIGDNGRYVLTYDQYTGALDVWEKA